MTEEPGIARIAVSLPESLLNKFDKVLEVRNYASRSEGIRDAVRMYVTHNDWISDAEGNHLGVISLVYSSERSTIPLELKEIERKHRDIVQVSLSSDLSGAKSMGILLVRGENNRLRAFFDQIQALRGIDFAKMSVISRAV